MSVVVADNHPLLLRGIASVFDGESDVRLMAQVTDGDAALRVIIESRPDVAVLNLRMPGKGALEVIEALRDTAARTAPVIIASHISEDEFMRALELGVRGFFLKSMPSELLLRCVRSVHAGEEFIDKGTFLQWANARLRGLAVKTQATSVLTPRENSVIGLTVRGLSNKDVARKLAISEGTVKVHLHRAYAKLGVPGRLGLFRYAKELGLA